MVPCPKVLTNPNLIKMIRKGREKDGEEGGQEEYPICSVIPISALDEKYSMGLSLSGYIKDQM